MSMTGFAIVVARMPRMRAPLDALQGELPVPSRSRPDRRKRADRQKTSDRNKTADGKLEFPPAESSGYLVRDAHRAFQRLLERRIAAYGVTRGQWYFLRVLWNQDGLSQRELSARVGMMEPTTVIALQSMERSGLIRRVRAAEDRRRAQVWLTAKAKRLRRGLLTVARRITEEAEAGIKRADLARFQRAIALMTANLDRLRK
jgi:MarR family transcriptional regulator, organic hydroperoxide resistance regulator